MYFISEEKGRNEVLDVYFGATENRPQDMIKVLHKNVRIRNLTSPFLNLTVMHLVWSSCCNGAYL